MHNNDHRSRYSGVLTIYLLNVRPHQGDIIFVWYIPFYNHQKVSIFHNLGVLDINMTLWFGEIVRYTLFT